MNHDVPTLYHFTHVTAPVGGTHIRPFPTYHPGYGYIFGSLFGVWLAALVFVGKPIPDLLLSATVIITGLIFAVTGFSLYLLVYHKQIARHHMSLENDAEKFLEAFPEQWAISLDTVRHCLSENDFVGQEILNTDGNYWKIVDRYLDDEGLTFILRKEAVTS